jgi:hypothetical protein
MPWKPIDPARAERERMRRRAMEAARPRGHNRAYKKAAWLKLRVEKLGVDPQCEFCREAAATEVDHVNGDAWDNRWEICGARASRVIPPGRCASRFAGGSPDPARAKRKSREMAGHPEPRSRNSRHRISVAEESASREPARPTTSARSWGSWGRPLWLGRRILALRSGASGAITGATGSIAQRGRELCAIERRTGTQ